MPTGSPLFVILAMGTAWLAAWIAIDRWQSQPEPQFLVDGIPLLAWYVLALLGLTAVLRWRSGAAPNFASMLALTLGVVPVPLLFTAVLALLLSPSQFLIASLAAGIYIFVYLARVLRLVSGKSKLGAALAGWVFIAVFLWLTDKLNVIPDVWTPAETQAAAPSDSTQDGEAILFEQAARIDQALAAFGNDPATGTTSAQSVATNAASVKATAAKPASSAARAPGRLASRAAALDAKTYFLGFAGVGEEKVFAQEIGLASRVLGERYDIDTRSLSLINDSRDLEGAPLATVSGLRYALQGMASRMSLDRDVLFLSISSHGASDPAIAVSNSQLPLNDLTDEDLADALRESGIKWRVVIISACYAGAFIDSLRNPQTIVIAAAAPDRTSFGCSNDRELTYFGEAFYRDALPTARTLRDAFEQAKAAIASRERLERVTPSNPQAYFGNLMEQKLTTLAPHE